MGRTDEAEPNEGTKPATTDPRLTGVTLRSFLGQLAVRLSLIGALLGFAGLASYSATHWEPHTSGEAPTGTQSR
jgi:hypothetical protein